MTRLQKLIINEIWLMPFSKHKKKSMIGQVKSTMNPDEILKIYNSGKGEYKDVHTYTC